MKIRYRKKTLIGKCWNFIIALTITFTLYSGDPEKGSEFNQIQPPEVYRVASNLHQQAFNTTDYFFEYLELGSESSSSISISPFY